jgi:putative endonuclease
MSNDVHKRLLKHNAGKGAKYTRTFRPCVLVWVSVPFLLPTSALILESQIKRLTRRQKQTLIYGSSDEPPNNGVEAWN